MNANVEEDSDSINDSYSEDDKDGYESDEEDDGKGGIRYMATTDRKWDKLRSVMKRAGNFSGERNNNDGSD